MCVNVNIPEHVPQHEPVKLISFIDIHVNSQNRKE